MDRRVFKRLIALILTGGVLLSSSGVYAAMNFSEETTIVDETYTSEVETTADNTVSSSISDETTSSENTTSDSREETTKVEYVEIETPVEDEREEKTEIIEKENETKPDNKAFSWEGVNATGVAGSKENPYKIADKEHFLAMSQVINDNGNSNKYFRLTSDIDLSSVTVDDINKASSDYLPNAIVSVDPEEDSDNVFFILDGNGKSIKGLNVTGDGLTSLAIFGYVNSKSEINNVIFNNIKLTNTYSNAAALGIILKNDGSVTDCRFTNITVNMSQSTNFDEYFNPVDGSSFKIYSGVTAGIVDNSGTFDGSTLFENQSTYAFTGVKVTSAGTRGYVGVAVAQNRGYVNKIRAKDVEISAGKCNFVGGMVGSNFTSATSSRTGLYYLEATLNKISGANNTGGIVGNNTGRIQYCAVKGTFTSKTNTSATDCNILATGGNVYGGITGKNTGDIQKCSAEKVGVYFNDTVADGVYGGIAGTSNFVIKNCVATGSTGGAGTDIARSVGGIIGIGSDESKFVVENCFTLVKILDSSETLGAVVGTVGDKALAGNRIRNCFYSSIVSGRPSPASHGGTGESFGDLQFSKAYANVTTSSSLKCNNTDFTFSGWSTAQFTVIGKYSLDTTTVNGTISSDSSGFTYSVSGTNKSDKIYYDVNIQLPNNIGNTSTSIKLENEPMVFRTLNTSSALAGEGTADSPYVLTGYVMFQLATYVPYAHYKFGGTATSVTLNTASWPKATTFWGSFDFNNKTVNYPLSYPMFKEIYGSRDNTVPNDETTHKSDPSDAADKSSNLANGVIKNLNIVIPDNAVYNVKSNILGSICNATVKNVTYKLNNSANTVDASEAESGVLIKGVYANSYIYGCYVDANVRNEQGSFGGLIGFVDAQKAIIDNCGSSSVITVSKSGVEYCASFIGRILSLDGGAIQNCYASGGVKASTTSVSLTDNNYIFAASCNSSAHLYNCVYTPSDFYISGRGVSKGIPDGSFTGSCKPWSFFEMDTNSGATSDTSMIILGGSTNSASVRAIENLDRFDWQTYQASSLDLPEYFSAYFAASDTKFHVGKLSVTTGGIGVTVSFDDGHPNSATLYIKHKDTGLIAKVGILTSSDLAMKDGYFLISKPTDLYIIAKDQGQLDTVTHLQNKYVGETNKYVLVADLDMTGFTIDPIGKTSGLAFKGEFKSGNIDASGNVTPAAHRISNLTISNVNPGKGLFGYVNGADISGIVLDNCNIVGGSYTGGIAGQVIDGATITNCSVTNSVVTGTSGVGGIVGGVYTGSGEKCLTTISGCTVSGTTVTSSLSSTDTVFDSAYVGGIIGRVGSKGLAEETKFAAISDCVVDGCEISAAKEGIGGITAIAPHKLNTITNCTVKDTNIISDCKTAQTVGSLGGIVGAFGGNLIEGCKFTSSTIKGDYASGIVTRLVNVNESSTISNCKIIDSTIESENIAAGILSQISNYVSVAPLGDKIITGCSLDETSKVKSLVAGGIVGNIQSFTNGILKIENCTNKATIETTGLKGSVIDCAGGIVGRFSTNFNTDGISITNCISAGTLVGSSVLGGVIGALRSNAHSGATPIVKDCYITASFSAKNLAVIKGLVIGHIFNSTNAGNLTSIVNNAVFSSFGNAISPYGNAVDTAAAGSRSYYDMNLGDNQQEIENGGGLLINGYNTTASGYILTGEGTNTVGLKTSITQTNSVYKVSNLPNVSGATFTYTPAPTFQTDSTKITLATTTLNNAVGRLQIRTGAYKGKAKVYTAYSGTVNDETVSFNVGFTVVLKGDHKFDGAGTLANPYKIYDVEDLIGIVEHHDNPLTGEVGPSFYTAYYTLMNDIDCSESCSQAAGNSFPSIGTDDKPFAGHISSAEGGPYRISNLYFDSQYPAAGENVTVSDNFGLFGYTDGASITDIIIENTTVKSLVDTNNNKGFYSGIVAGKAVNTTISNVSVIGNTEINVVYTGKINGAVGGVVGFAGDGVVMTDVSVTGESDNIITVQGLTNVGGLIGFGSQAENSSLTNVKVSYVDVISTAESGTSYAGGLAGTFSGTVNGTYETVDKVDGDGTPVIDPSTGLPAKETVLSIPCTVENVNVKGIVAGGAFGAGSENSGNNNYGLSAKGVRVNSVNVYSTGKTYLNGFGGGFIGTTFTSYKYRFEDCIVDNKSSVSASYVAGGLLGRAQNNGGMYDTSLLITNCTTGAALTQREKNITGATIIKSSGVGGVIGVITNEAKLMNPTTFEPLIRIENTTGGGVLKGDCNVGGIIGQLASIQTGLYQQTDSFVEDCIVTAEFDAIYDASQRFGVVCGSIEGNSVTTDPDKIPTQTTPYPDTDKQGREYEYTSKPFDKIFYSSYMSSEYGLFGLSEIYNYQYNDFTETIYDVNKVNFGYDADGVIIPIGVGIVPIFTSGEGTVTYGSLNFGTAEFFFEENFQNQYLTDEDTVFGFSLNSADFKLKSITSSDTSVFEIEENKDEKTKKDRPYKIVTHAFATADLIFTYENGLQIGIPIVCGVNFDGEGTADDPIQVTNEDIFFFLVKALPGYYFSQTVDLDFTGKGSRYSITAGNQLVNVFKGYYNGNGHTITGLNATFDMSDNPAGYFGTVQGTLKDADGNVLPNVSNVEFVNCSINSGDTTAGTGIVAGKLAEGATIQNVRVTNCSVTSTESTSNGLVGGAIGTVAGESTVDGLIVKGTTVTTASGSAGGAVGTVTSSAATLKDVIVSGCNVTTGNLAAGTFMGGATSNDIAGGIVAQAVGTITGPSETDEYEVKTLKSSVYQTKVNGYISGGAVGAVYVPKDAPKQEGSLNLTDVRITDSNITAKYDAAFANQTAGAGLLGVIKGETALQFNNCYVDKKCTVDSYKYASGIIATNESNYFTELTLTDVEGYATVTASQNIGTQIIYAGGTYAYLYGVVNPNDITMDGCVAGGKVTANGWTAYAGGVFGAMDLENVTEAVTTPLFTNGVISSTVFYSDGQTEKIKNSGTSSSHYYGKFIAGFNEGVFVDDDDFSTKVFHDNLYSSYPQDYDFFGMYGVDNFQSVEAEKVPFENINVGSNFVISTDECQSWNAIAITRNLDSPHQLYAMFNKSELEYGNGKISTIDKDGFSVNKSDPNDEKCCVELDEDSGFTMYEDAGIGTYYGFIVYPREYGAALIGAAYECGLSTTVPILCVEIHGTGTEADPFLITNPTQLAVVRYLTGNYYYYRQTNDIDLTNTYNKSGLNEEIINYNSGMGFAPIGTASAPFKGCYDGQGYTVKGLFINRETSDNVGLFGSAYSDGKNSTYIKNVHVELLDSDGNKKTSNGIVGNKNVGGLVGSADHIIVENCSVVDGMVVGKNDVGGLIGTSKESTVRKSFTESDVNAFGTEGNVCAGGIIGSIDQGLDSSNGEISGCFATGSIYAPAQGQLSDIGYAGGIVGYIRQGSGININNCLFTGTTASGHGIYGDMSAKGDNRKISSCIDAGQNIAMTKNSFAMISSAVAGGAPATTFSNVYYDSSLLKVDHTQTNYGTEKSTTELTKGETVEGISSEKWTYSEGFYPVPVTEQALTVVSYDENGTMTGTQTVADKYSKAYAGISSVPILTSEKEEASVDGQEGYGKGIVYPVSLINTVSGSKVKYSSSIFDTSDTVVYPKEYDTNLYGNKSVVDKKEVNNKNVDLLFEDKENLTSVYRNLFNTTIKSVKATEGVDLTNNTRIALNSAKGTVFANGEAIYNLQVPVVFGEAEIDGVKVKREFKIPMSYGSRYCVATERQLFALGSADYEVADPGSKFASYYCYYYDYKLIRDIEIQESNTTMFKPIGNDNPTYGYIGQFDGSGHTIKNLTIKSTGDYVGMFSMVSNGDYTINTTNASYAYVKDLNIVDATVEGRNYVGSLIGCVKGENVTVSGCGVSKSSIEDEKGTVKGTGSYVGGLIGYVEYPSDVVSSCYASNTVTGSANSIGGLIGESKGTIKSCYATGNVLSDKLTQTSGVGGLIGYMAKGTVSDSFASGNVEVKSFKTLSDSSTYGIGGCIGIVGQDAGDTNGANAVIRCFSGGNVSCGTGEVPGSVNVTGTNTGVVGVGGFCGVNNKDVINCYSSAAVVADFETIKNYSSQATYGVGIGGVTGVSKGNVQNVYSSGSVANPYVSTLKKDVGTCYYGVGGTVGTTMNSGATVSNCYFDKWTNTNVGMTSVGDKADDSAKGNISYTTKELTSGKALEGWDTSVWGFSGGAYPYLRGILNEGVAPIIKVNAILSVLSIEPDDDDLSARSGKGITMALTVPTTFKYTSYTFNEETETYDTKEVSYELAWSGTTITETGGITKAAINRTKNVSEYIDIGASVVGLEDYGQRTYRRLCSDMRGTYQQPYFVGSVEDLMHVCMTPDEHETAKENYTGFYDQWVTPLDEQNQPVQGTVYYQLMSDIDASELSRAIKNLDGKQYKFTVNKYVDEQTGYVPEETTITYDGFVLNGNAYSIKDLSCNSTVFAKLDSKSRISNVIFNNLKLTKNSDVALVGENNGGLYDVYVKGSVVTEKGNNVAGLVLKNNGIIDGCVADVSITGVANNCGVIAVTNTSKGKINNTGASGSIVTDDGDLITNIGGFVADNAGTVTNSFAMVDGSVNSAAGAVVTNVGGFAGQNSGTIDSSYSRTGLIFANEPAETDTVAAFVGNVTKSSECVTNCYIAGNLGYFNESQQSIAFGTVAGKTEFKSVYVDKAIAGGKSANSFVYAVPTKNIIELKNAAKSMKCEVEVEGDNVTYGEGSFVVDTENKDTYPKLVSILKAENSPIKDENNEAIVYEDGTVLRNYEVLKAYSDISVATIITANSQYIDCLALDSNDNGINSTVSADVKWSPKNSTDYVNINNVTNTLSTTSVGGEETVVASFDKDIVLSRNTSISPKLYIRVKTGVNNPNFSLGGFGTEKNPYQINDASSLQSLSYYGANKDLYFKLANDIDMKGFDFKQIPVFSAKLNNDGKTKYVISNLTSNSGGLFGTVDETAVIKNVGLNGVNIKSDNVYVGGLADHIDGATVNNVFVIGKVEGTKNDFSASVGALAGCISNTANIDGVVTTGEVIGAMASGGIAGCVDTATVKNVVSTAKVTGTSDVGGIVGIAQNGASITGAVFGGTTAGEAVCGKLEGATSSETYYDVQLHGDETTNGTSKTTSKLANVFSSNGEFKTLGTGYYPIPAGMYEESDAKFAKYEKSLLFAVQTIDFFRGSSKGNIGYYTSFSFNNSVTYNGSKTNVTASEPEGYLAITSKDDKFTVKVNKYVEDKDPVLTIKLGDSSSMVYRAINPGLVKTANITYDIKNSSGIDLSGTTVGVLIRNTVPGSVDADAICSFTKSTADGSATGNVALDGLLISSSLNGFYIGDMLPDGYEFEVKASLNGKELPSDNVKVVKGQDGTFVNLDVSDGSGLCNVKLDLTIVKSTTVPWGIRIRHNTLWG